jgi:hypothetical protein
MISIAKQSQTVPQPRARPEAQSRIHAGIVEGEQSHSGPLHWLGGSSMLPHRRK